MLHVDDYLDAKKGPAFVLEFLEHARRPAIDKDYAWMEANAPTVTWRGGRFLCVGASRMGDVWLRKFSLTGAHYDHRVDVADLSDWAPASQSIKESR